MSNNRRGILIELRRTLIEWVPRRIETVEALKKALDDINCLGVIANTVKFYGAAAGAVSNAVAGFLGLVAILGTGGMATPLVVAGGVASVVGVGASVASGGAEVAKMTFPKKMEEAEGKVRREVDLYKTVIHRLKDLGEIITEKLEVSIPRHSKLDATAAALDTATNLLTAYSFMNVHVSQIANGAASGAAFYSLNGLARSANPVTSTASAAKIMKGLKKSKDVINLTSTKAAKTALDNSTVSWLLPSSMTTGIAETAGKNGTDKAFKTFGQYADNIGGRLILDNDWAEVALRTTTETAAPGAREGGRKLLAGSTSKSAGSFAKSVAGEPAESVVGIVGGCVPLLNFVFAAWDGYEAIKARTDIAEGTEQEKFLKQKILELEEETNRIVVKIFNVFADAERRDLRCIDIPFPDCHNY